VLDEMILVRDEDATATSAGGWPGKRACWWGFRRQMCVRRCHGGVGHGAGSDRRHGAVAILGNAISACLSEGVKSMSVQVYIPTPFAAPPANRDRVSIEAPTMPEGSSMARGASLRALKGRVATRQGQIHHHVEHSTSQRGHRGAQGARHVALKDGDEVCDYPALAGGRPPSPAARAPTRTWKRETSGRIAPDAGGIRSGGGPGGRRVSR
jgi:hypothetical protein